MNDVRVGGERWVGPKGRIKYWSVASIRQWQQNGDFKIRQCCGRHLWMVLRGNGMSVWMSTLTDGFAP